MASPAARKRLSKEFQAMQRNPPPFCWATPEEKNILNWHFILRGPPDSVYEGGEYHGIILFPNDYPFKPPDIKLFTPSGRFKPDTKICTSMTSFHPSTWNPAWSCSTILTGLLSFMLSEEITTGATTASSAERKALAAKSHAFNIANKKFREIFPDYAGQEMRPVPDMHTAPPAASTESHAPPSSAVSPSSSSAPAAAARSSALPPSSSPSASSSTTAAVAHAPPPTAAANLVDPDTGRFNLNIAALPDAEGAAVARAPGAAGSAAAAGTAAAAGVTTGGGGALQDGRKGFVGGRMSWIAVVLVAVLVGVGKLGSGHWLS